MAWDLTDRSLLSKLELPFRTYGLTWCSPDHVLVNRSSGSDEPDVLIDVVAGLPVWNYGLERGSSLVSSPDGRAWFLPHSLSSSQLLPMQLPDERVTEILTRVPLPDSLIGPGSSVTIHAALDDPPEEIPPGWAHLEQLDKGLEQLFAKQLQDKHVVIAPRSPVRLIVGVEERKLEETMRVGRLLGPSQQILVSATVLIPYVAVVDSDGKHVWSKLPTEDDLKPIDLGKCPPGMDKEAYLELQQWDRASDWLHGVEIPSPPVLSRHLSRLWRVARDAQRNADPPLSQPGSEKTEEQDGGYHLEIPACGLNGSDHFEQELAHRGLDFW